MKGHQHEVIGIGMATPIVSEILKYYFKNTPKNLNELNLFNFDTNTIINNVKVLEYSFQTFIINFLPKGNGIIFVLEWIVFCIFYVLGLYLPDCDQPHSTIGKYIRLPFRHRTWTHTIWFVLIFVALEHFTGFIPFYALALGTFCHIFVDSFSIAGICYFFPCYKKIKPYVYVKENHYTILYRNDVQAENVVFITNFICVALAIGLFLL